MKKYLVFIGPSGVGKSSLVHMLYKQGVVVVWPTYTTRPARQDEADAIEHVFISKDEFAAKKTNGDFISTVKLFGLPYEYGLPREQPEVKDKITCVMLRAPVIDEFRRHYTNFIIYQVEANKDEVETRLGEREQPIGDRLKNFQAEVELGRKLASKVFVNDGDIGKLAEQVVLAIKADFS